MQHDKRLSKTDRWALGVYESSIDRLLEEVMKYQQAIVDMYDRNTIKMHISDKDLTEIISKINRHTEMYGITINLGEIKEK